MITRSEASELMEAIETYAHAMALRGEWDAALRALPTVAEVVQGHGRACVDVHDARTMLRKALAAVVSAE